MATQADVRRIALALPGTHEATDRFAFSVRVGAKEKGYCWVWLQRVDPRRARVPCADVLAVRVADNDMKEMLLLADPRKFFTEPHYDGYPAVLVRLAEIGAAELRALITQAWQGLQPAAKAKPPKSAAPRRRKASAPAVAAKGKRLARKSRQP